MCVFSADSKRNLMKTGGSSESLHWMGGQVRFIFHGDKTEPECTSTIYELFGAVLWNYLRTVALCLFQVLGPTVPTKIWNGVEVNLYFNFLLLLDVLRESTFFFWLGFCFPATYFIFFFSVEKLCC